MMPGQHHPNQDPRPPDEVRPGRGKVWAQGRWRDKSSRAAEHQRQLVGRRVERAVEAQTHGTTIYAYSHVRTNQVVYSLTKIMRNGRVMGQLNQVYHGKKTVPAALRRDLWRPYWRVDFPSSPGGKEMGRLAFRRLRELSLQRQLEPPDEMVVTTEEDVEKVKRKYSPAQIDGLIRQHKVKLPIVGQLLPKKMRARKLMDQKATSVADLALCLGLQEKQGWNLKRQLQERGKQRREDMAEKTRLYRRRMRFIEEEWKQIAVEQRKLAASVNRSHRTGGNVGLDSYARRRIAMAQNGLLTQVGDIVDLHIDDPLQNIEIQLAAVRSALDNLEAGAAIVPKRRNTSKAQDTDPSSVNIVWADPRDQKYAQTWPSNVIHAQLEQKAVVRSAQTPGTQVESSVHVIAGVEGSGRYTPSSQLQEVRTAERERKMENYQQLQKEDREEHAIAFQRRLLDLELRLHADLVEIKANTPGKRVRVSERAKSVKRKYEMQRLTLLEELNKSDHDRPGTTSEDESKRFSEYADVRLYLEETLQQRLENLEDQLVAEKVMRPVHELRQQITQAVAEDSVQIPAPLEVEKKEATGDGAEMGAPQQDTKLPAMRTHLEEFLELHPEFKQAAEQIRLYERHNLSRQNEFDKIKNEWNETSDGDANEVREKIKQLRERSHAATVELSVLKAELSVISKGLETKMNQEVDELRQQRKDVYAEKGKSLKRLDVDKFSAEVAAMPSQSTSQQQEKLVALLELRAREAASIKAIDQRYETKEMAGVRKELDQLRFQQREMRDKIGKTEVETAGHEDPVEIRGLERQREQLIGQIQQKAAERKKLTEAKEDRNAWRGEIRTCQRNIRQVERQIKWLQRLPVTQSTQTEGIRTKIKALRGQIIQIKPGHEKILVEEARQRGRKEMDDAVRNLRAAMRQDSLAVIEEYRRLLGSKVTGDQSRV